MIKKRQTEQDLCDSLLLKMRLHKGASNTLRERTGRVLTSSHSSSSWLFVFFALAFAWLSETSPMHDTRAPSSESSSQGLSAYHAACKNLLALLQSVFGENCCQACSLHFPSFLLV